MAAAEGSQRARDPRPGGLRRDRQLPRDLLVGHVLDNAQLQHAALLDRQAAEQLVDTLQPALLGRNTRPVGVLEGPEPLPGAVLKRSRRTDCNSTLRAMPYNQGAADPSASSRNARRTHHACANVSATRSSAASSS